MLVLFSVVKLFNTCALQRSPLLLAAMHGHERVVEILLKQDNVDVNVRSTTTGYNCLCEAIIRGHR